MKIKKVFNYACLLLIVLALTLGFSTQAYAVHKGAGGLDCSGCHTMHNSQQGLTMGGSPTNKLLQAASTQALCLTCHTTGTTQYTTYPLTPAVNGAGTTNSAAGTFAELDGTNDAAGQAANGKGHNLGEGTNVVSPPGGSDITGFTCTNCHDPHGVSADTATISAYRNLRFAPTGSTGAAPTEIRGTKGTSKTGDVYPVEGNAYGSNTAGISNISQWCGTCHNSFWGDTNTNPGTPYKRHPTGNTTTHRLSSLPDNGVNYLSVGEGSRFPAEDTGLGTTNSDNTTNKAAGDDANDGVFCLSCHKAHATAYADALRWNYAAQQQSSGSGCQQCHNK